MNIAYLSTFYPLRGGIAQFNASLLHAFEDTGNSVNAFTFRRQYPQILFPGKSQYVGPDDPADPIQSQAILDTLNPVTYYKTASTIASTSPDFLLMKFWMPFFAPSLGTVAKQLRKKGIKIISILDNVIPHEKRPGDIQLINYFLRQNDGFIVMSNTVKSDLLSLYPTARFTYEQHPLYNHFGHKISKDQARQQLKIGKDKKVLLFFGFIRSYKGLDILLEALPFLPEDYIVVIAGEIYGTFDKYQKIIEERSLQNRVQLHVRYIGDAEFPAFFCASDICVLPYRSATQSGIIPIAYHFDLPVIITEVGSLKEMVEPYGTGLIARTNQPQDIAEAIQAYFQQDMETVCTGNIRHYKERHSWHTLAKSIIGLYQDIRSQ